MDAAEDWECPVCGISSLSKKRKGKRRRKKKEEGDRSCNLCGYLPLEKMLIKSTRISIQTTPLLSFFVKNSTVKNYTVPKGNDIAVLIEYYKKEVNIIAGEYIAQFKASSKKTYFRRKIRKLLTGLWLPIHDLYQEEQTEWWEHVKETPSITTLPFPDGAFDASASWPYDRSRSIPLPGGLFRDGDLIIGLVMNWDTFCSKDEEELSRMFCAFTGLKNLQYVVLDNNRITSLPDSFRELKRLRMVFVNGQRVRF